MSTDTIDHEAIRERYLAERDKRLREDGNSQYIEPTGRFAHFLEDPYVKRVEREPLKDEVTVAIIGGGWAGLVTGARLKEAGVTDVRIIEGGGDVGGVWYWNRYPGAMCDTAAMVYLPLLEETGHVPTMKYVQAPEIWGQAKRIANQYNLYDNALFSTQVRSLEWDESISRWIIRTDRGDEIRAKFITQGTGPLQRVKLPGIPGIETFAGHCFHTSRWDYEYTGGSYEGDPMVNLADKRVGIIGTGATAVQCIPALGASAGELFVFQRTPSSVDIRNNHPIDPEEFAKLKPGWQQEWYKNFATLQTGGFADEDLVKDGWTDLAKRIRDRVFSKMSDGGEVSAQSLQKAFLDSDDEKMEEIRARVDEIVKDKATADALKPWYRQLCKRPCFHDEYLQTYNRPNVQLVDTNGKGVERIDETGVWVEGKHYELDCLIFASGFEVGTDYARRSGFETIGRGGHTLSKHWADGMQTYHGIHMHDFPNAFIVGFSQGGNLVSNIPHNLVDAGATIAAIISHAIEIGAEEVEVTEEAEREWVNMCNGGGAGGGLLGGVFGNLLMECTPGYYNNEGKPQEASGFMAGGHPGGPMGFFNYIEEWRNSGDFKGLEFRTK